MPEQMGGGAGLLDYDGDGWLDVYLVQGGSLVKRRPRQDAPATGCFATWATAGFKM